MLQMKHQSLAYPPPPPKFTFHSPNPPSTLPLSLTPLDPSTFEGIELFSSYSYHPAAVTLKADLTASRKHASPSGGLLIEAL